MSGVVQFSKDLFAISAELGRLANALAVHGQGYFIYPGAFNALDSQTPTQPVATPAAYGLEYQLVDLMTADEVKGKAYLLLQKRQIRDAQVLRGRHPTTDEEFAKSRPTVLMFHGNGADFGQLVPLGRVFYLTMRCNVLISSYRGYGGCEGTPSERGLKHDSQAALDYLTSHPLLASTRICLYGQSLGGAVAIDLASRNTEKVQAVVVENTFLSLPRLVPLIMPIFTRFTFFLRQKWDSATAIKLIPPTTPILLLSGGQDEVVPPEQMKELFEIACENGKTYRYWKEYPAGTHNDTFIQEGYWRDIAEFIGQLSTMLTDTK